MSHSRMTSDFFRQCYVFLGEFRLCANVQKSDGHQELEMCEYDPSVKDINAPCTCRDPTRITCIHTAIYVPPEKIEAEGKEGLSKMVSSEGRRIDLPVEQKFEAFKMWTSGIAEANEDAFVILGQLDDINRAYPIAKPLLAHAARAKPEIFDRLLRNIRQNCTFEGKIHKPCIIASVNPIIEAAQTQKNTKQYLDALKLLDLVEPVTEIKLINSKLENVPKQIAEFKKLSTLILSENSITNIPEEIIAMPSLKEIDLAQNRIETIPKSFGKIAKSIRINLDKNVLMEKDFDVLREEIIQVCTVDGIVNKYCVTPLANNLAENATKIEDANKLVNALVLENMTHPVKKLEIDFEVKNVPSNIGLLDKLESLIIHNTSLEKLPTEIGRLKRLKIIDISNNSITELPQEFWDLVNLEEINIESNGITEISPKIGKMEKIRKIDASNNGLTRLPTEFSNLVNLKDLSISQNKIENIDGLANLKKLENLQMEENAISSLPENFGTLTNLKELSAQSNQLITLPKSFANLKKMKKLDLSSNKLTDVSPVWQLNNLETLALTNNQITVIPDEIKNLINLKDIDISQNKLTSISAEIANLPKVEEFGLESENMQLLPKSMQDKESMLFY